MVNLVRQEKYDVRKELAAAVLAVRDASYDLPRDVSPALCGAAQEWYSFVVEGNRDLREALRNVSGVRIRTIADFCCGGGSRTRKLAADFKRARVYGFDVVPRNIKKAQMNNLTNPRLHFEMRDVYDFDDGTKDGFDAVVFNRACGPLADKVIQYATSHNVPVIAGKFCCYHTISSSTPDSKSGLTRLSLKLRDCLDGFVRKKLAQNYIKPPESVDRDLLSEFAEAELGMDEQELERVAVLSVDARIGARIIDLNRMMKLIERGYDVALDGERHVFVATKK